MGFAHYIKPFCNRGEAVTSDTVCSSLGVALGCFSQRTFVCNISIRAPPRDKSTFTLQMRKLRSKKLSNGTQGHMVT